MSYILDALRKLETEKERKARGSGMINIAGELLKNGSTPPRAHRNWPIILGLVLLASLVTFGATFLFLHGGKGKKHTVSAPLAPPVPMASIPQPPPLPVSAPKPPVPPPGTPPAAAAPRHAALPPAKSPEAGKAPSAPRHAAPPPARTPEAGKTLSASRLPRVAEPARPAAPEAEENVPVEPAKPAAASLVTAPADIKVSGIAWQERRSASRVVVNGFLMKEGDSVSGARVTEIFQNRVRFSSAAGPFEVYLVATGLPAPPK